MKTHNNRRQRRALAVAVALMAAVLSPAVGSGANAADDPSTDAPCGVYETTYEWHFNNCAPQHGRKVWVKYRFGKEPDCVPARTDRRWVKFGVFGIEATDEICDP